MLFLNTKNVLFSNTIKCIAFKYEACSIVSTKNVLRSNMKNVLLLNTKTVLFLNMENVLLSNTTNALFLNTKNVRLSNTKSVLF